MLSLLLALNALASDWVNFESDPVRPLALADGELLVANLPGGRLERLDLTDLSSVGSVPVGLDPVAIAVDGSRAWVVNQQSDSVSVVDLDAGVVSATLHVGDEPRDAVIASGRLFVAAARRGQNLPEDPQPLVEGLGRADVWVFDLDAPDDGVAGTPLDIVTLFGDVPRALAVSADGTRVHAAVFKSGNRSTVISDAVVCDGGEDAAPCEWEGRTIPFGAPGPNADLDGNLGPELSVVVHQGDDGIWRDALGRDWSGVVGFELPDLDVFTLDAASTPPVELGAVSSVGTVLYAMAERPGTSELWVANTEANNADRFVGTAGPTSLVGELHRARLTAVDAGEATPYRLNPHLDYDAPSGAEQSLSQPTALVFEPDGSAAWVAGYGSQAVSRVAVDALANGAPGELVALSAGGPAGLALDGDAGMLYVYTRFDNGVSAVDIATRTEVAHVRLPSPEPAAVVAGRPHMFEARNTATGEASCGGCHVFGDTDHLAWELSDPGGVLEPNPNPPVESTPPPDFHPLKGPMTTQTLRGVADAYAMHWRGDRNGGLQAGGGVADARASFLDFGPAFVELLDADAPLSEQAMDDLATWALSITPPPNPYLPLDGSRTEAQEAGRTAFLGGDCVECHAYAPEDRIWGADGSVADSGRSTQFMKVPSLRQAYQKVGFFWAAGDPHHPELWGPIGPQVRGFGMFHDGQVGRIQDPFGAFVLAFDTNLAPIVGQQITLTDATPADRLTRLDLLVARADAGDCDLIAHTPAGGLLYADGAWSSADGSTGCTLDALPRPATLTCAAPGTGARLAIDADRDGTPDLAGREPLCVREDTGLPVDSGDSGDSGATDEATDDDARSCGCATSGVPVVGWLLLLPLVLRRRR
ncbi:MAG: hypothetical protein EP330_19625 [Deltaproteobacteria bacterium]|nr:MAG: hypothetical protein EP330_19625 [Deltaproteobacteria bacterium]